MKLYSERNGFREPVKKTAGIDNDTYSILWDCCERYKINLAWKFPEYCYDKPQIICGICDDSLKNYLNKAIPGLYYGHPSEPIPNPFILDETVHKLNLVLILDYIEFIAQEMKTVLYGEIHPYFGHNHITFDNNSKDFNRFRDEINNLFETCGLLYFLTENKVVERIVDDEFVIEEAQQLIEVTPEKELKKLIEESVELHKSRKQHDHHLATEKIWDAFERLKTIDAKLQTEKSQSTDRIIKLIAGGKSEYEELFKNEFDFLRKLGNDFRIRHHETYKIDVPNDDYYDYFFSRCFALIVLSLKYINSFVK